MSVKRNEDGSITIKSNNSVTTIGKIISVYTIREDGFSQWVENCAKSINPCSHTFAETEQYFLQLCDGQPLGKNDRRMRKFQLDLIMNYYKDKLKHQASQFSVDMTDEEIEKWHKEDNAMRNEAMNSSPEHFGLNIRGYYLPHTERNAVFYEEAYAEVQELMKRTNSDLKQAEMQDICFFFEETTGHWQCDGGGRGLMNQLIVFRGVSQDDIEKRSPRFHAYITALGEMGDLPGIIEEK